MKHELSTIIKPYLGTEEWGHDKLIEKLEQYIGKKIRKSKKKNG